VIEEIIKQKVGETKDRWERVEKDQALSSLWPLSVLETRAQHFLRAMELGTVSTNIYLRRIHNFALGMNWLPVPVIPKRMWPGFEFKAKRAISLAEHQAIVAREKNPDRLAFYQLAWHLGASQSDIAFLEAENIDWENQIISYARKKTGAIAFVRFGKDVEHVLRSRPAQGPLFPYLRSVRPADRATEFKQRCKGLSIEGVTLHSYRYAWAERARKSGFPERFAQEALGHNSKAVHRAYARKAKVIIPTLESFEQGEEARKVIPLCV
jgi:integrase